MNDLFNFMIANQALVWVIFLAPIFLVMWRGYILEGRAMRQGMRYNYNFLMVLSCLPLLNIAVALICTARTVIEFRRQPVAVRW